LIMTDVSLLSSVHVVPVVASEKAKKPRDLGYLAIFAAVGLFFSVLSYALTPTQLWPEGTVALAPEMVSDGVIVSQIPVPAGLQVTHYSTH
jgi:hypothetical protein